MSNVAPWLVGTLQRSVNLALAAALAASLVKAAPAAAQPRTVNLIVSVVWEGRDLQERNLAALTALRDAFPDVAIAHFISPAYFLRADAEADGAAARIRQHVRPGDRIGLTLGGWRSVAMKAGVIFRNGPTFWGPTVVRSVDCSVDCGQDIPVHVYPEEDLGKLITTGLETLEARGFGRPRGLVTSGWVASAEVLEAAAKAGIRYDFSAVAPEMLTRRAQRYPLLGWIKGLWPQVTPHTQPHVLTTASAGLTEMPQSLGAVDYLTVSDIETVFKEYVDITKRDASRQLTFPLMIFQETAATSLPVLRRALTGIFAAAAQESITLVPLPLPGMEFKELQATPEPTQPVAH